MKSRVPIFLILLFTVLLFNKSYGQEEHTVTLICDVAALENSPAHEACSFSDQEPGTDSRDYTIYVTVGDSIFWNGESSDGDAAIDIKKIKYDGGTNVFDTDEIDGSTTVIGLVKKSTKGQDDYKYKISFKVDDTGKMYTIDPKVSVTPRG